MDWFQANYLDGAVDRRRRPAAAPLLADDLSGLPPALLLTGGFDPLRDEGDHYAAKLAAAGVTVDHRQYRHWSMVSRTSSHSAAAAPPRPRLRVGAEAHTEPRLRRCTTPVPCPRGHETQKNASYDLKPPIAGRNMFIQIGLTAVVVVFAVALVALHRDVWRQEASGARRSRSAWPRAS